VQVLLLALHSVVELAQILFSHVYLRVLHVHLVTGLVQQFRA